MSNFIKSASLAAVLAASAAPLPAFANNNLMEMSKNPADWVMPLGNYQGHRYSALDKINTTNVHELQVAWSFSTGRLRGHEGAPLKVGNRLYFVTPFPNDVFALDLDNDGKIAWTYKPTQDPSAIPVMCCDTVNRGLAYADGMLFLHQADTHVVAIDAMTGDEIWKVKNGDHTRGETGTAAPLVVKDKVIVGISGSEFGVDCHVTALDMKTGKRAWRAYTNGSDGRMLVDPQKTTNLGKPVGNGSSVNSWDAEGVKTGGGCAWGWITYDPDLNLIYYGTGNPAPWNSDQRPGANRWTSSIIARDADTGVARWVYQMIPHNQWGYDGTAENILVDMEIDGATRKVLKHFDANGFAYLLDRETGMLLKADKFDIRINWANSVDANPKSATYGLPDINPKTETKFPDQNIEGICPTSFGATSPAPAAWHPISKQFLVPITHKCMDYEPFKVTFRPGQPYMGATFAFFPAPESFGGMGLLSSWSSGAKKAVWSAKENLPVVSGPLVTKGNLAFYGTSLGYFKAVRLSDGKELFKFKTGSSIIANPIAYEHNGKQFIAVLSGAGGWEGIGLAAGLCDWGAGHYTYYHSICHDIALGGNLFVFALPDTRTKP